MCLAVICHRHLPEWPVFVAANRDEFYDRPSRSPEVVASGPVAILAPRDERAGGTWLGVNDRGVFAVITNRSDLPGEAPPGAPSRGLLVWEVLCAADLRAAEDRLRETAGTPSAPFNLVLGDRDRLLVAERTRAELRVRELAPGVHVVANGGAPGDASVGEVRRAQALWAAGEASPVASDPWSRARDILSRSDAVEDQPALLKDHGDRGTVSSTLFGWRPDGELRFLHAPGPPHITEYQSFTLTPARHP